MQALKEKVSMAFERAVVTGEDCVMFAPWPDFLTPSSFALSEQPKLEEDQSMIPSEEASFQKREKEREAKRTVFKTTVDVFAAGAPHTCLERDERGCAPHMFTLLR